MLTDSYATCFLTGNIYIEVTWRLRVRIMRRKIEFKPAEVDTKHFSANM
jgi:hypothetical protein